MTEMVHAEERWRDRKGPTLPSWPERGDKTVGPALGVWAAPGIPATARLLPAKKASGCHTG